MNSTGNPGPVSCDAGWRKRARCSLSLFIARVARFLVNIHQVSHCEISAAVTTNMNPASPCPDSRATKDGYESPPRIQVRIDIHETISQVLWPRACGGSLLVFALQLVDLASKNRKG